MSVVGYDDIEFASMLSPTLTSIRQPRVPRWERPPPNCSSPRPSTAAPPRRHPFRAGVVERQSTTPLEVESLQPTRRLIGTQHALIPAPASSPGSTIVDGHCHAWLRWPYQPPVPDEACPGAIEQLLYEMDTNDVAQAMVVCAAIGANEDNLDYVASAH